MPLLRRRRIQYRAVVRFSIFDPTSIRWKASRGGASSPEEYRDYLWSSERLGLRFRIFGDLALPAYQEMADRHDFRVLVQHSTDLPEPWLGRLRDLADAYPVMRAVPVQGWVEPRDTVHADLQGHGRAGTVVMLRVDDDDILAIDYLDQLGGHVRPEHHGWAVSLGRGVAARVEDDAVVDFRQLLAPFSSIGQAYVGRYTPRRGGVSDLPSWLSHERVHRTLPTVVDSRKIAFVQVRHADQDTLVGEDTATAERRIIRDLSRLPEVGKYGPLRKKFPTLAPAFDKVAADGSRGVAVPG